MLQIYVFDGLYVLKSPQSVQIIFASRGIRTLACGNSLNQITL